MWENNRLMKKMSGRSISTELLYDIDMLEMIRWPSIEDTPDLFEVMTSSCQGRAPYDSLFPFQHIVPCHDVSSSLRNVISDDSLKSDFYFNRIDCDDDDNSLMVTSNDALRFEEDCLFELSPSPSCRNVPPQSIVSGAESGANRFLCQRNSMADMTLAQLNDSNASDTKSHRVDLAELKVEVQDLDLNFDQKNENFSSASKSVSSSSLLTTKDNIASRLLPSKQNNISQQPLFAVKDEYDGSNIAIKREIKTENNLSPVKFSSKTSKALKRCRTSSFALSEGDGKDESKNALDGLKSLNHHQGHDHISSISSSNCWPVGKKIKLEITESACDDNEGQKVIIPSNDVTSLPPHSSKSVVSEEEENGGEGGDSDDLSDTESVLSKSSSVADVMRPNGGSEKRYFWQYNIQAKGPKEKRLCKNIGSTDPHVIKDFEDPVFDPGHSNIHFVHSGKARKGDGTDITPNPHKLLQIGCELKTLNCTIEDMMLASDFVTRTTTMKEKNKYASRVCRLKKKAQHEANKIKLQGLNEEHNQLMSVLNSIKSKLRQQRDKTSSSSSSSFSSLSSSSSSTNNKRQQNVNFTEELDNLTKSCLRVNVAGRADDYVSSILLDSSTNTDNDDIWLYSD